jgi:hypothetical protein
VQNSSKALWKKGEKIGMAKEKAVGPGQVAQRSE